MDNQQQENQRRNFAITKSRLQHMKHDPSVSIDDFISKMLVSSSNFAGKSSWSPKFPHKSPHLEAQHPAFNPSFSNPKLESNFISDDTWNNFKSSFDKSTLMQPMTIKGDKVFNFDADFGGFTSFESTDQTSTPNLILPPAFDLSSLSSSSFQSSVVTPIDVPTSSHSNQTSDPSGPLDEFSDFVGSRLPSTPSVTKKSPLSLHVIKTAKYVDPSPAPALPKEQLVSESALNETDPEDGFEDFQACAYESPSTVEQIQRQLPTEEWLKCLSECRSMLSESASILSSLVTDSDVDAFVATPRGNEFILELIEIYGIIQRIRLAASLNDLLDSQLQAVFNQIDRVWGDLARFVKNQDHKLTLKRRLVQSVEAATTVDPLSVEPNCGVCVTPVPASSTSSSPTVEAEPGTAVISLAGRVYHASCANLWVNRIELSLPSLRVR
ncbi:Synergin gamma [Echinococcus granulosus]|nr:Synergin gamma [Echinococcus granulosus]